MKQTVMRIAQPPDPLRQAFETWMREEVSPTADLWHDPGLRREYMNPDTQQLWTAFQAGAHSQISHQIRETRR